MEEEESETANRDIPFKKKLAAKNPEKWSNSLSGKMEE